MQVLFHICRAVLPLFKDSAGVLIRLISILWKNVLHTVSLKIFLTKAFRKLKSKTAWYCAFNIAFSDEDYDVFYPLTVRISVPKDIEAEYTNLYYTPNRKSILGRMAKEITEVTLESGCSEVTTL